MKKQWPAFLTAAVFLLVCVWAAAEPVTVQPGPFAFRLPADAGTVIVGLNSMSTDAGAVSNYMNNAQLEITGTVDGAPYVFNISYTPMELGVKESWEPVIKGLNPVYGGKTVEGDF